MCERQIERERLKREREREKQRELEKGAHIGEGVEVVVNEDQCVRPQVLNLNQGVWSDG